MIKKAECLGLIIEENDKGYHISGPDLNPIFLGKRSFCKNLTEVRMVNKIHIENKVSDLFIDDFSTWQ